MTTAGDFDVQATAISGAVVLRVSGELDLATAADMRAAVADVSANRLVIDLSSCTFLDSSGVRVLAECARERSSAGRTVRLVAADPSILRVLEITGLDKLMAIHSSVTNAL